MFYFSSKLALMYREIGLLVHLFCIAAEVRCMCEAQLIRLP